MRKTIRKVTMVVPVLMTSCQVSLYPKNGPVTAHTKITPTATPKAAGRPVAREVVLARRVNHDWDFTGRIGILLAGGRRRERHRCAGMRPPRRISLAHPARNGHHPLRHQAGGRRSRRAVSLHRMGDLTASGSAGA